MVGWNLFCNWNLMDSKPDSSENKILNKVCEKFSFNFTRKERKFSRKLYFSKYQHVWQYSPLFDTKNHTFLNLPWICCVSIDSKSAICRTSKWCLWSSNSLNIKWSNSSQLLTFRPIFVLRRSGKYVCMSKDTFLKH